MVKNENKPIDEQLSRDQYNLLAGEQFLTEQDMIQQEVYTRVPGFISFLKNYELKPLIKIIVSSLVMVGLYFLFGWDTVVSAVALFAVVGVIAYMLQTRNQDDNVTVFVEMRLPGQKIEPSDFSPYEKTFFTTTKQFAIWQVPNNLLKHGLFTMPGEQNPNALPGSGQVVFCDLFDRLNRTCVLPKDMDVANICLATNANPMLAEKMNAVGEQIRLDKETEGLVMDMYNQGNISEADAAKMIRPVKIHQKALMSPTGETKRDIFFELQSVIPELREKLQEVSNSIFLLADFIAARGIYQSVNKPMPEQVRKDHNLLYKIMGLPTIRGSKSHLDED